MEKCKGLAKYSATLVRVLGVGLTLALLTSLVVAVPAAGDVSQLEVTLDKNEISRPAVTYTIIFQIYEELSHANGDSIIVRFPVDTDVSDVDAIDIEMAASGGIGTDPFAYVTPGNVTVDIVGRTVVIYIPSQGDDPDMNTHEAIGLWAHVKLDIGDVTNPSVPGDYTLLVSTSAETTLVQSAAYAIVPAPGVPQYGGNITFTQPCDAHFDPASVRPGYWGAYLCYDTLLTYDLTRGPGGTGEFDFSSDYIPEEGLLGGLAESWERPDLLTLIYHIRPGVYFHNKPPVNGRELTADDVVYSLHYHQANPNSVFYVPEGTPQEEIITATAVDKYTVVFELPRVDDLVVWYRTGTDLRVVPHEIVEEYGDLTGWQTVCGTGPFTVVEHVVGIYVTFERNPNYWQFDPFHPENRLPYADGLIGAIIPDESTQLAALRVGVIDHLRNVSWGDAASLTITSPDLLNRPILQPSSSVIQLRNDKYPFSSMGVRWALSMGIDREAIAQDFYGGEAEILTWTLYPDAEGMYTPLGELPASARELFEYNPEKARQLLAQAGYPDGFPTQLTTTEAWLDLYSIVKGYWADIGVELQLDVKEPGVFDSMLYGHTIPQMSGWVQGNWRPGAALGRAYRTGHLYNFAEVVDPYIDETYDQALMTLDTAVQNSIIKYLNIYALYQSYYIPLPTPFSYIFWQPWLKGYHGEAYVDGANNRVMIFKYAWLGSYDLTIYVAGNGTTLPEAGVHSYRAKTRVNLTAIPDPGWEFSHWSGTNNNNNPTTVTMNSDKSVTAYFHEAVADILDYYRGLGDYPDVVETQDLLKAANDWANEVIPPGFSQAITTQQLLELANEWAAG